MMCVLYSVPSLPLPLQMLHGASAITLPHTLVAFVDHKYTFYDYHRHDFDNSHSIFLWFPMVFMDSATSAANSDQEQIRVE